MLNLITNKSLEDLILRRPPGREAYPGDVFLSDEQFTCPICNQKVVLNRQRFMAMKYSIFLQNKMAEANLRRKTLEFLMNPFSLMAKEEGLKAIAKFYRIKFGVPLYRHEAAVIFGKITRLYFTHQNTRIPEPYFFCSKPR